MQEAIPVPTRAKPLLFAGLVAIAAAIGYAVIEYEIFVPTLIFGAIVVAVVFVQPRLGLYLLVALIPFEAGLLLGDSISFARLAGYLAFSAWLARKLARREPFLSLLRGPITPWLVAYVSLALASFFWATYRAHMPIRFLSLVQLFGLYLFAVDQIDSWKTLRKVFQVWVLAASVSICVGLYQYFALGVRRAGFDTIGSENEYAAMILVTLPLLLYYLISERPSRTLKLLSIVMLPMGLLGLAVALSRTGFVALPIILLLQIHVIGWRKQKYLLAVVVISILLAYMYVPWDPVLERIGRIDLASGLEGLAGPARYFIWKVAVIQFLEHPFLGVGYYNFGHLFTYKYQFIVPNSPHVWGSPRSPHSLYFGILADLGIMGIVILLGILYNVFRAFYRARKSMKSSTDFHLYIGTLRNCMIAYLIYSMTGNTEYSKLLWLFYAVAQVTVILSKEVRAEVPVSSQPVGREVAYGST